MAPKSIEMNMAQGDSIKGRTSEGQRRDSGATFPEIVSGLPPRAKLASEFELLINL